LIGDSKIPTEIGPECLFANPESDVSEKIFNLVEELKRKRPSGYSQMVVIKQGSANEAEYEYSFHFEAN
jgi:hypothetical protein